MKAILVTILLAVVALTSGCNLPEHAVRQLKANALRSEATSLENLALAATLSSEQSPSVAMERYDRVYIKTDIIAEPAIDSLHLWQPRYQSKHLNPSVQAYDAVFHATLIRSGFRSVTPLLAEFGLDSRFGKKPQSNAVSPSASKSLLLLVTIHEPMVEPRLYEWKSFVVSTHQERLIGSDVRAFIQAKLVDAETSESIWVGSATVQALVAGKPTSEAIVGKLVELLAAKLPSRLSGISVTVGGSTKARQ